MTLRFLPAKLIQAKIDNRPLMHFYKTPPLLQRLSKNLIWNIPADDRTIYLTFDDGPIPQLTEYILDILDKYNAEATFFCVGDNLRKYPKIARKVVERGHRLGNHTFNHLKGWQTNYKLYVENIDLCQRHIALIQPEVGKALFRPPHGQITPGQIKKLYEKYHIIMWEILTYDFENSHNAPKSLEQILKKTKAGSIVVFHDNYKAREKLKYMLPRFLAHFRDSGYQFKKIGV